MQCYAYKKYRHIKVNCRYKDRDSEARETLVAEEVKGKESNNLFIAKTSMEQGEASEDQPRGVSAEDTTDTLDELPSENSTNEQVSLDALQPQDSPTRKIQLLINLYEVCTFSPQ